MSKNIIIYPQLIFENVNGCPRIAICLNFIVLFTLVFRYRKKQISKVRIENRQKLELFMFFKSQVVAND